MAIKTETKQVKIDKAMLTKAMQVQTAAPPSATYKIDCISGTDVFERCLLQFGKIPEVSGYMFVVDYTNPNLILAAYAPGTWSRARIVLDEELAAMKNAAGMVEPQPVTEEWNKDHGGPVPPDLVAKADPDATTETPAEPVAEPVAEVTAEA